MRLESFAAIRLPNQSTRIMGSVVEEAGLAWQPLLQTAGIPADVFDEPDGVVTGSQELRLQDAFAQATRHLPGAWFRMGQRYRLITYGPLGLAVLSSEDFGTGLRLLTSLNALTYSLMQYSLVEEEGNVVALSADDTQVTSSSREFSQERALGSVTQILIDMHPALSPILRIETVLDAGKGRHECENVLGVPVVFGARTTRWVLKPGVGQARLPMASPMLEAAYGKMCARLVEEAQIGDEIACRLYALLVRQAPRFPVAQEACRMLGLSERTLYRKLAVHGLTFGQLVDQVRENQAIYLLDTTRLSIEAVAEAVGFSETASFSRAFKRWKGISPLRFRCRGTL